MFRYLILGLLRNGAVLHGYALMKEYWNRSGIQVSSGNFYRELQRLAADGFVCSVTNPVDADARRAPYEITETGAAAFDAWLVQRTGAGVPYCDDEISARAIFVPQADPSIVNRILERWQEELWSRGKGLERAREAALARSKDGKEGGLSPLALLLARRLKYVASDLEFIDQLRMAYQRSAAASSQVAEPRAASSATRVRAVKKKAQETPPRRNRR